MLREDIENMKKEVKELKEQSFAMEILGDYKKSNKRWFIAWIITFLVLIGTACYIIYLKQDTGTITKEIEIDDVDKIDNSHIKIGDDIWEKLD